MRKLIFILIALISFSHAQTIQYIGAPTTTVISRGNFRTDSIFYLPKRTKTPTDTAAFRYQISDSSLYYWTGYQWTKVQSASSFASVDTTVISTRAWRQKGIDSVQYNVGLKVNISDTASMLSPYIVGSGTSNYFPKFNATRSIVDSKLYESNLNLLFNTTTPYVTTSGISTIENNGTSAALYVLKTLDTARAYISFGGANTMDINNLRAGDIRFYTNATLRGRFQTDGTFRLNSLTGTGSRIVVADDNGVLSATSSATGLVDTTLLSTRAYRQKGDDSLGAIIATKGSGTVTSVATGYGLSGGTITTTGTLIADTALVASRLRLGKVADSLSLVKQNVLTNPVTGTGTTNYVPKFTGTSTIGNSLIYDNGSQILINTTSSGGGYTFRVNGSAETTGNTFLGSSAGKVLMNYTSASPAELRVHNTAADNQQLILSNDGTYHTGFIASQVADVLSDSYAWGMFGGVNSYITGTSYAVGIALGSSVPHFQITRHNNLNGGVTQNLMRITSAGEVFINTTTDAGAYTLQNNGALYNTGGAILAATSGDVGIGTTSPAVKLQVIGNIRGTRLNSTGGVVDFDAQSGSNFIQVTGGVMNFANAGAVNASINAAGEFLFGTTTDAGNYRVQVSGNSYLNGDIYVNTTTGFNTLFTQPIGGGGIGMVSLTDPTASGNRLFSLAFGSVNYPANARIEAYASEAWSSTARGTYITFRTTPNGSTGVQDRFYIGNDGIVSVNNLTPSSSAQFEVFSTTRGFLPPRMTTTQRDAISSPAAGLVIYNTTTSKLQVYTTSWTDLH